MKYKLKDGEQVRTVRCAIASATVIAAGDLVAIDTGLIIKAVAASTAVAWCPNGSAIESIQERHIDGFDPVCEAELRCIA